MNKEKGKVKVKAKLLLINHSKRFQSKKYWEVKKKYHSGVKISKLTYKNTYKFTSENGENFSHCKRMSM